MFVAVKIDFGVFEYLLHGLEMHSYFGSSKSVSCLPRDVDVCCLSRSRRRRELTRHPGRLNGRFDPAAWAHLRS
eukprot:scaffold237303_cov35-Prasinocladus_malaysianus.AAC.1